MPFAVTDGELRSLAGRTAPTNPAIRPYGMSYRSNLVHAYEVIYRTQANIRTVVDYVARQFGGLELRLLENIDQTTRKRAFGHPLDRLVHHPHPRWSRARFGRTLASDLLIYDNFLAVKVRVEQKGTQPVALTRIPIPLITPEGGDFLTADAFRLAGTSTVWRRDEVVHVAGYNPEDPRWGLSPIESLRQILEEDIASTEARSQFWDRAARFGNGWISRPVEAPDWTKRGANNATSARDSFLATWRDLYTGSGPEAGGTPVLEEGMEFHAETFDAKAAQYIEARELTGVECSRAYHVHPSLLGFQDAAAEAQEANRRSLLADVLAPLDDYVASELTIQLLPDFEAAAAALDRYELDFDLEAKLRGDFLTEAEATSRAVGAPWLRRNEARARRGLEPVEGGDDLITPLNVTTGGRANPTDTAPGTPGLGQASRTKRNRRRPADDAKALDDLPPLARSYADQHAAIVADNVDRQAQRFRSRYGVGHDSTTALDLERANTELGDDLAGLALDYAPLAAAPTASAFGIDYNLDVATPWLLNNARIAAANYNAATLDALNTAEGDADIDTREGADAVFALAAGTRAIDFALGRVNTLDGFASHDAAQQGGATTKTWLVNSDNPRETHAALDGVTIPIGEDFDVGGSSAPWPGSPELPVEEVAGCTCTVDFA